ncbi:hypothetical protein GCM10011428_24830 [Streptomyces violaceus]
MALALDRIRVGSAPDSWGVWFPDDPQQVPWVRFLDEVAEAGYSWIELGPYGYLPTDPARLTDEVTKRNLKVSAGTIFCGLHRGPSEWDSTWEQVSNVAALTQAMKRRAPRRHPVLLARRQDRRDPGAAGAHHRAVAQPHHGHGAPRP